MREMFSWVRFSRLLKAHWSECWREYVQFFSIAAILDVVLLCGVLIRDGDHLYYALQHERQRGWYIGALLITATIFAARYFRHFSHLGASLITLLRPASCLEKWLQAVFFVALLYPLAFSLLYVLLHFPAVMLAQALYHCDRCTEANFLFYFPFLNPVKNDHGPRSDLLMLLIVWSAQAIMLAGALYFRRSPVLSLAIVLFVVFLLMQSLQIAPMLIWFDYDHYFELMPPTDSEQWGSITLWVGIPLWLWLSVLFHLKQREVA